jgi:cytochrome c-type biogenesis protein CcmF
LADVVLGDGYGLNPLLQDPWMVIHPPVIFVGYAAAGVPFALAMAALIINDYSDWVKRVFPWVAVSALMIGMGNILGAYWAYKTLGWGGYWAWDPVENSSLIPCRWRIHR